MSDFSTITWSVEETENIYTMEPVYLPDRSRPLERGDHRTMVFIFCVLSVLVLENIYFYLYPVLFENDLALTFVCLIEVRAVAVPIIAALFMLLVDRLIRVLHTRPDDEKVPWTWVTKIGHGLYGKRGLVILIILMLIPSFTCFMEHLRRSTVVDGKVSGLELSAPGLLRRRTLEAIEKNPDPAALASLINIAQNDTAYGGRAVRIIKKMTGMENSAYIVLENDGKPFVCVNSITDGEIKKLARSDKSPEILRIIISKCDWGERKKFAQSLGDRGDRFALKILKQLMVEDESWGIKFEAAKSIAKIDTDTGLDALINVLENSSDQSVAGDAITALSEIGLDTKVIDALMTAWGSHKSEYIKSQAHRALREIMPLENPSQWVSRCRKGNGPWIYLAPLGDIETAQKVYEKKKHRYVWDMYRKRFIILPESLAEKDK
jgi:hypothetical protein